MTLRLVLYGLLAAFLAGCTSSVGSVPQSPGPQPTAEGECAGVKVIPLAPRAVYKVRAEDFDLALKCQIQSALRRGAYVVADGTESAFIDMALDAKPTAIMATTETTANGTPDPNQTAGPIPSPLPTRPAGPTPTPRPTPTAGPVDALASEAVGFVNADGVLRTYEVSAETQADAQAGLTAWEAHPLADGPTPPPANKVWSLIGENRQEIIGPTLSWKPRNGETEPPIPTGKLNILTDVWRLSTNDRHNDYFMVGTVMSSTPNYFEGIGNACWPICRYWTWRRNQAETLTPYYGPSGATEDIGPRNGIQVDKLSFEVGGNLGAKIGFGDKGATGEGNAGISAKYGQSWDQPHAQTSNLSTVGSRIAEWHDATLRNFMSGVNYDYYAWQNITTTGAFTNGRIAIFILPRHNPGSPVNPYILPELTNSFLLRGSGCALFFTATACYQEVAITSTQKFPVWMPTFSIDTKTLTIKPKATATFRIRVRSTVGESAKAWQIVKDPNDNHLTVTPHSGSDAGDRSEYQTITVKAQPGAVPGTTYTLYVNTVPAGGADSLRYGSLLVEVHID